MNYKKNIKVFLLINICCVLFARCSFAEESRQDFKTLMIMAESSNSIKDKIDYYNKATDAALKENEPNYMQAAQSAFNVGLIAGKENYLEDSIKGYSSCILILNKAHLLENSEIGFLSLYNVAQDFKEQNQTSNVKATYEAILVTQKKYPKKYNYYMSKVLYELGYLNLKNNNLQLAEQYFNTSITNSIESDRNDVINLKTSNILRLAEIKQKLNEQNKAINYYNEAILRSQLGYPDIISIGDACSNVGIIYQKQGNLVKAKPYYEKAIKYYKKAELDNFYLPKNNIGNYSIIHPQKEDTYKRLISLDEKRHEKIEKINLLKKESSQYIPIKIVK